MQGRGGQCGTQPCSLQTSGLTHKGAKIIAGSPPKRGLGDIVTRASLPARLGNAGALRTLRRSRLAVCPEGRRAMPCHAMTKDCPANVNVNVETVPAAAPGGLGAGGHAHTSRNGGLRVALVISYRLSLDSSQLAASLPRFHAPGGDDGTQFPVDSSRLRSRDEKGSWWLDHQTSPRLHLP